MKRLFDIFFSLVALTIFALPMCVMERRISFNSLASQAGNQRISATVRRTTPQNIVVLGHILYGSPKFNDRFLYSDCIFCSEHFWKSPNQKNDF
jgi:hypothetical protein